MKSKWLLLVSTLVLPACVDGEPTAASPEELPSRETVTYQSCTTITDPFSCPATGPLTSPATYWRSSSELWVYDKTPEVGLHTFFPVGSLQNQNIADIAAANVRMVRIQFYWEHADPDGNGNYGPYMTTQSQAVNDAIAAGLVPVVTISGLPPRFRHYPGPISSTGQPTEPNDVQLQETWRNLTRFVRDASARMPNVRFWQILNEMDGGHSGVNELGGVTHTWSGSKWRFDRDRQGRNYKRLMDSVYVAVKQAGPNDWVVMGGLTGTPWMNSNSLPISDIGWDFLTGFYAEGGRNTVDFLAIHAYGNATGDPAGPHDKGTQVLQVMAQNGDVGRPLWLTEFGGDAAQYYATHGHPGANAGTIYDNAQATKWQQVMDGLPVSSHFTKALGYSTSQGGEGGALHTDGLHPGLSPGDYGLGIFRLDQTTKRPAYWTVANHWINNHYRTHAAVQGSVQVFAPGIRPVGYSYTRSGSYVTIQNVQVNKLVPTRIQFEDEPYTGGCYPQLICG